MDKRLFVSHTLVEFTAAFFDCEKIEALGFTANMNLPAVADGRVVSTLNLLGRTGDYTPEVVAAAMAWQPALTLAFLKLQLEDIASATLHSGIRTPQNAGILEG
ncbi:hypothetical protein BVG79_p1000097 (plasmid) [Ketogulonicigenium robustum]|uniref:Uncharacterized protein n=1 Tax=Ketogulonicigenium robustum TaxID=92947 RepID=A0A1W6P395_9RHOB|nr:hypothetical protein [Ketogulonicigenium robustum]ARO15899.1 hypothetical protein BVG79_p1000097 [Ketogulonicigenium robustum]